MLPVRCNKLHRRKAHVSLFGPLPEKTAMLVISISRQERITLTAISPRLATKILLIIFISQLNAYTYSRFSTLRTYVHPMKTQYFYDLGLNNDAFFPNPRGENALYSRMAGLLTDSTSYRDLPDRVCFFCQWCEIG